MMKTIGVDMRTNLKMYLDRKPRSGRVDKAICHGVIEKMEYAEQLGYIRTSDDRRFCFELSDVLDTMFYSLEPGSEVRFVRDKGDQRAQASNVYVLGTQLDVE